MANVATDAPIVLGELRDRVKWISFNRPQVKNAIGPDSADRVAEEVLAAPDEKARVIVLTGTGGSFCSGADLKALAPLLGSSDIGSVRDVLVNHYHPMLLAMTKSPLPVIAAVDGAAAGIGSDTALAADIRLASDRGFFAEIFVNISLLPDGGGTFTLPRLIGMGRALEMAMTGARVGAEQALAWGMVNHVYPTAGFEAKVQEYAEMLAVKAPLSLARTKQAMRAACENMDFHQALLQEATLQQALFQSQDLQEGVMAFLEKRPPNFQGK